VLLFYRVSPNITCIGKVIWVQQCFLVAIGWSILVVSEYVQGGFI
jgi:hypothetical protein